MTWKTYRHRFFPWVLLNWNQRSHKAYALVPDVNLENLFAQLHQYIISLNQVLESSAANHLSASYGRSTAQMNKHANEALFNLFGFNISQECSIIPEAGKGVVVRRGSIPSNTLVALYPGLIYEPGDPILLQSLRNQFIFRCSDGTLIDGNDRGLSRMIFRSCAGRDIVGPHLMCDISWLTDQPINPLAIGQYINNSNKENPANVEYQEINLSPDFPWYLLKYIPNIYYRANMSDSARHRRLVVLRSIRDIAEGEELFSTYFTTIASTNN